MERGNSWGGSAVNELASSLYKGGNKSNTSLTFPLMTFYRNYPCVYQLLKLFSSLVQIYITIIKNLFQRPNGK